MDRVISGSCAALYGLFCRSNGLMRTFAGHSQLAVGVFAGESAVRPSWGTRFWAAIGSRSQLEGCGFESQLVHEIEQRCSNDDERGTTGC